MDIVNLFEEQIAGKFKIEQLKPDAVIKLGSKV